MTTKKCTPIIKRGPRLTPGEITVTPDRKLRLFDQQAGAWQGANPHDQWLPTDKNRTTGRLKGDILHYSYYTLSDHIRQIEKFTEIMAQDTVKKGKTCSLLLRVFEWLGMLTPFLDIVIAMVRTLWPNAGKPWPIGTHLDKRTSFVGLPLRGYRRLWGRFLRWP